MNGAPDFTQFDRDAVSPYIDQAVTFHRQRGVFRRRNGAITFEQGENGANFGNGIEDVTEYITSPEGLSPQLGPSAASGVPAPPSQGPPTPLPPGGTGTQPPPPGGIGTQPPPPSGIGTQPPPPGGDGTQPPPPGDTGVPPGVTADPRINPDFTAAFNTAFGQPGYDARFDYNRDKIINVSDLQEYGRRSTPERMDQGIRAYRPSEDLTPEQIDQQNWTAKTQSNIDQILTAPDPDGPLPRFYSQFIDGYKTHLEGASKSQRDKAFAAPHVEYKNYVISQLAATPELEAIMRGEWTPENVDAVVQAIVSGEGILSRNHLESIPEALLSSKYKQHIYRAVTAAQEGPRTRPALGDPGRDVSDFDPDQEVDYEGDVTLPPGAKTDEDIRKAVDGAATMMRRVGFRSGTWDIEVIRGELAEQGFSPDQIEQILKESQGIAGDADSFVKNLYGQMEAGEFDEEAARSMLEAEGFGPKEIDSLIAEARSRYEGRTDEFGFATPPDPDEPDPDEPDPDEVEYPAGWVDNDGDGFDDNTDLDIDGTPRTFTQEEPPRVEGDIDRPGIPDTDDTIQDILTYLRDASQTEDGIDNIAARDLNKLSRSAEKAQEQLMEDLNRLGLAGMETGDAQAAIGEFKGAILARQDEIRAGSDERIRDNIDKLINVAGLEVTKAAHDENIKSLKDSIESRDQLALFNGLLDLLGPSGMNLLSGVFDDGGAGPGTGPDFGGINIPEGLWGVEGLDTSKLSAAFDKDGKVIKDMFSYTNAAGDTVNIPKNFDIMTDSKAIEMRAGGMSNADIMDQMAATKPPKWFDRTKLKQAAGFLALAEMADQVLPGVAGAIAKGASQGAAIGSIVPIIGTTWGAAIGAGIAGVINVLGIGMSGHNDRQIESSWHPAILDVLFQKGFTPRDKVSKAVLDEIAGQLKIPFTGKNSIAFRRSSHYQGADIEKQDKIWFEAYQNGELSREDFITRSLASSVGNSEINLNDKKWG
jgi:hypothetical protein